MKPVALIQHTEVGAPGSIPQLLQEGYQLVTVSELAAAKGITLENGTAYGSF